MPTHDFIDIGDVLDIDILRGTVTAVDSATDTCSVNIDGSVFTALLFYHCTPNSTLRSNGAINGAAKGFAVGQEVIVLKKHDNSVIKVIGHVDGIHRCVDTTEDFYGFYIDGATIKVSLLSYAAGSVVETKTKDRMSYVNSGNYPVIFHLKRFTHNVPAGGSSVARDLYFIATSLYISPAPFAGWTAFAVANPTHGLVTNNANSEITLTAQVTTDLNYVNAFVNNHHTYAHDPAGNDNWQIMTSGATGDCEDFALTKADMLLGIGYPASALHIEVARIDSLSDGHAWLVVQTTGGDFALDIGVDTIQNNSSLRPSTGEEYFCRRRQIGSNWAFTSSFGWMFGSQNVSFPWTFWYILDPLLNIIYSIPINAPGVSMLYPFPYVAITTDASELSGPSINFSEDNDSIHVAYAGTRKTFSLDENVLTLVSQASYTTMGFVGRDGNIVGPIGATGRQDPFRFGGAYGEGSIGIYGGVYYLAGIDVGRRGSFKALCYAEVVSENGFYSYHYRYLTGEFSVTTVPDNTQSPPGTYTTFLVDYADLENTDTIHYHQKSVVRYDSGNNVIGIVNDPVTGFSNSPFTALINKAVGSPLHGDFLQIDPLFYPYPSPFDPAAQSDFIHIPYGNESINRYGTNYVDHGAYYPYQWTHVEARIGIFLQALMINRATDGGDDLKRLYVDGASSLAGLSALLGTSDSNVLGIAYIPGTDRLNRKV